MKGKYVAYIGSYSYTGSAKGITICDVDVERGVLKKRTEIEVNNSSYLVVSRDQKTLYSIVDEGVVAFHILENGALSRINTRNIRGMRGCHLAIDRDDEYLMVSGYHDGKATLLRLEKDGSVGPIVDGFYDKGIGSVAERTFRPHVSCSRMTDDQKYILVADLGIDQVKIFRFDKTDGKMRQIDTIRCELKSAPRHFRFSPDRRFLYLMYEVKNVVDVFTFREGKDENDIELEKIQTISTHNSNPENPLIAACQMRFSPDKDARHLFVSNAGIDTLTVYNRDPETGLLTMKNSLPVSGEYPKDFCIFPDEKHVAVANNDSGEISFFSVDYETGMLVMNARSIEVDEPNCIAMARLG
ncbi:lactonase family protein [Oribacterium sp. oral taxon 102]|uniref:lactonase family protein n=1 Tax=Oribacterium sp. oral taxon 102 TaxID=671214 RepID=UPI0015BB9DA3|nr:lactonase family protein [Oribacterium sp. oral taxon 102]NWO21013.1 lactonase family protein [Oribacterium sp. oral taxon 102]